MDELELVRELRPQRALPSATVLQPARIKLLDAIAAEQRPAEQWPANQPARRSRRAILTGLAAAAAVATVLVVAPWHGSHGAVAAADPVVVLHEAAQYAAGQPFAPPRPDQFLFVAPDSWYSIDDTHDGRSGNEVLPGCRDGRRAVLYGNDPKPGETEPCTPNPLYLADAPTTAPAMRAYLLKMEGAGGAAGLPNRLGKTISGLFSDYVLSPAATAALFNTLTTLPGLRAIDNAQTIDGQHGVGVTWNDEYGAGATMIFDRNTHRYLGMTTRGMKGELGGAQPRPHAVVDRAGELPG